MSSYPENATNRRVGIQNAYNRGMSEQETMNELIKREDGESPITLEEIKFWYRRFESGNWFLEYGTPLENLMKKVQKVHMEPEKITSKEESIDQKMKNMTIMATQFINEFRKESKDQQKESIKAPWLRRLMIVIGQINGRNENETMNWIKKITGMKKSPIGMEEIEFFYRRIENAVDIDFKTPFEQMKKEHQERDQSVQTLDSMQQKSNGKIPAAIQQGMGEGDDNFVNFLKGLHSLLLADKEKIVQKMEIGCFENRQETIVTVRIGSNLKTAIFRNEKSKHDHQEFSLIDIWTFLEFCHDQNATIETMMIGTNPTEKSPDFLKKFVQHEIVGKVNIESLIVLNKRRPVSDSLELGKYVKCKVLTVVKSYFEYGRVDKFVAAMRNCHPDLKECIIGTRPEEVPHYFHFWKKFDDFKVRAITNTLFFKKSDRKDVEDGKEN